MPDPTQPRYPIYIPSKGRADICLTPHVLDRFGVPYTLIVEAQEEAAYQAALPHAKLLVLDPAFQDAYDTCDDLERTIPLGSGPARNMAWADAISRGADWHWIMDDNLQFFDRFHQNRKVRFGDGSVFYLMESFATRWRNVSMAGPNYHMFVIPRTKRPPFQVGTRIYSCNLIRNSVQMRWRGRWNEDTILSLDMLKAGWQTILFNAYLQFKTRTQLMRGGTPTPCTWTAPWKSRGCSSTNTRTWPASSTSSAAGTTTWTTASGAPGRCCPT